MQRSKVNPDEPFYFCDVCAGPGGFSEYVLWRNKWKSKGFGMTLKQENDFKLDDFLAGSPAYFETYYGKLIFLDYIQIFQANNLICKK